jgi:hypothetical protein
MLGLDRLIQTQVLSDERFVAPQQLDQPGVGPRAGVGGRRRSGRAARGRATRAATAGRSGARPGRCGIVGAPAIGPPFSARSADVSDYPDEFVELVAARAGEAGSPAGSAAAGRR